MVWDWMVFIGRRQSKSTFCSNKEQNFDNDIFSIKVYFRDGVVLSDQQLQDYRKDGIVIVDK